MIAVVDNKHILLEDMSFFESRTYTNIADLAEHILSISNVITSVWLMPGTVKADLLFIQAGADWDVFSSYSQEDVTRPCFSRIWKKKTSGTKGRTIYVSFPEYGQWEFNCTDSVTLLASIVYLKRALGVDLLWSPGHVAMDFLTKVNAKNPEWLRPSLDAHIKFKTIARDMIFKRPFTLEERFKKYLHRYDKNSAYLSASTNLFVGEGETEYVPGASFDNQLAGYWKVKITGSSIYDGIYLPKPFFYAEWLPTHAVFCAQDMGYNVEVLEGRVWKKRHRVLEKFASKLWDIRKSLKNYNIEYKHNDARKNAYNVVSLIAHISIGRLAYENNPIYRPDIWAGVVTKSYSVMVYNIEKIRKNTGLAPVLVQNDALYYLSDNPDPRTAVNGILDRESELGGYKIEWEEPLQIDDRIIELFDTISSPTRIHTILSDMHDHKLVTN